jgi:hypothetical protein
MPDELAAQIPMVHAACEALGVPILTSERYEADDVIGTLATKAVAAGFDVAIVTGDKDFFQLVHDGIRVFNPKEDGTWYDAAGVKDKFGVAPEQVVDVLALMGDTIDNIKGVPGIGEKGALSLIATYGSLEQLIANAAQVSNKRYREGLLGNVDSAQQSRELARIRTDVPVEFDPAALKYAGGSRDKSFQIFNELAFRSLAAEYAPTAATIAKTYRTVTTDDDLRRLADRLRAAGNLRCACSPTAPRRCARASSGSRFRRRRVKPTTCPCLVTHGAAVNLGSWTTRGARSGRLLPLAESSTCSDHPRRRNDRQVRPRSQVRRDRARATRCGITRPADRHDAGQLSHRRQPVGTPARGSRARAHELQGTVRGGCLRQGRQSRLAGESPGRCGRELRLRARRSRRSADANRAVGDGRRAG